MTHASALHSLLHLSWAAQKPHREREQELQNCTYETFTCLCSAVLQQTTNTHALKLKCLIVTMSEIWHGNNSFYVFCEYAENQFYTACLKCTQHFLTAEGFRKKLAIGHHSKSNEIHAVCDANNCCRDHNASTHSAATWTSHSLRMCGCLTGLPDSSEKNKEHFRFSC